jgi:hypothetical protein
MNVALKAAVSATLVLAAASASQAATVSVMEGRSMSGNYAGMQWTARNMLTGVTNTQSGGPVVNGGDPLYWPTYPAFGGTVHLLMDYGPQVGMFICSGSLLSDRRSILTAGHCVSDGANTANPLTTTVYFQPDGGLSPGTRIQTNGIPNGGAVTRSVTNYFVNSNYTGDVIDQNDIAVLRLDSEAPAWSLAYDLYTDSSLTGADFTVAGYGRLGDGATGANNFAARLRQGDNRYDFRLGDPLFNGGWAAILGEPAGQIAYSWVSDFDNGLAANDTACRVAQASNLAGAAGAVFCNLGRGAREVGVAGGDSGGPNFINGRISGVNSYGLTFGAPWGDIDNVLNSSFGEFSGYVPVHLHVDFIRGAMVRVPEPGSLALLGLGLAGLGLARRRKA